MRAVTVSEYGGIPVVGEIPTPEPGAGQVLLRVRAAGMNPMDGTFASGAWRPRRRYSRWSATRTASPRLPRSSDRAAPPSATKYVADPGALAAAGVTGINFNFAQFVSGELLEQVAGALVGGRIAAPPITRITLEQAPAALNPAQAGRADGKTVITL